MSDALFTTEIGRRRIAEEWLPSWLRKRRWFGGSDREIRGCRVTAAARIGEAWLFAVAVEFGAGVSETYVVPLTRATSAEASAVVAAIDGGVIIDATHVPEFR